MPTTGVFRWMSPIEPWKGASKVKIPPSLVNIYKELQDDIGCKPPPHGYLASWASQGVMLLNTLLTVKANEAGSHKGHGWEEFTDAVIKALSGRKQPMAFLRWGNPAQAKEALRLDAIAEKARHRDKRLPKPMRERLQTALPRWAAPAPAARP